MQTDKTRRLQALADEIRDLEESGLYEFRQRNDYQPVIGEGNPDARIVLVGEAPGEQEANSGRPFVGRAGKILDELLESIGMKRGQVYITNVVKDRPPGNRDPSANEIELYAPFLMRQLAIIEPAVIVTLGRIATESLLQRFDLADKGNKLGDLHGKPIDAEASFGDVVLLPMYHPAAAFYNRDLKEAMYADFEVLKRLT